MLSLCLCECGPHSPIATTVLLCVLGLGVGGVEITPLYGVSEVWEAPKGMAFGLVKSERGVNL